MKKILLFITVVGIINTSCDIQDDGELFNYIDTFSICSINSDGSGYRKVIDNEYTNPQKQFTLLKITLKLLLSNMIG